MSDTAAIWAEHHHKWAESMEKFNLPLYPRLAQIPTCQPSAFIQLVAATETNINECNYVHGTNRYWIALVFGLTFQMEVLISILADPKVS